MKKGSSEKNEDSGPRETKKDEKGNLTKKVPFYIMKMYREKGRPSRRTRRLRNTPETCNKSKKRKEEPETLQSQRKNVTRQAKTEPRASTQLVPAKGFYPSGPKQNENEHQN